MNAELLIEIPLWAWLVPAWLGSGLLFAWLAYMSDEHWFPRR